MHILVIGAAGMLGRKLTERLVNGSTLNGETIEKLTLVDVVMPPQPVGFKGSVVTVAADVATAGEVEKLAAGRPDIIFHLAAIVSGEAEREFENGYRINFDGTRYLLEAIRKVGGGYRPRVIYASSGAVFAAPFNASIADDFHLTPISSYGTQKAMCELLLADYSRKGYLDGVGVRLPTICVRPGKANAAVTGFFSSIIRGPLIGHEAVLPVPESVTHTHASPRSAIAFLVHAAGLVREQLGTRINLTMPGINCTVGEQIAALKRVAGDKVAARIRHEPDEIIQRIVGVKPRVDATRARDLGFNVESNFDEIILAHIEDELGGKIVS